MLLKRQAFGWRARRRTGRIRHLSRQVVERYPTALRVRCIPPNRQPSRYVPWILLVSQFSSESPDASARDDRPDKQPQPSATPAAALVRPAASLRRPAAAMGRPGAGMGRAAAALGRPGVVTVGPVVEMGRPAVEMGQQFASLRRTGADPGRPFAAMGRPFAEMGRLWQRRAVTEQPLARPDSPVWRAGAPGRRRLPWPDGAVHALVYSVS